jgi:hypothetical protein
MQPEGGPTLKEYVRAEERIKESLGLRGEGFPHNYPGRDEDLSLMRSYHNAHGYPPAGTFGRLLWRLRGERGEGVGANGQMQRY